MAIADDQQFCLRWNNFQANITSQFETLRDDEDFTDVTIACEGQRLQAHKVVLSACSPLFKELFKSNPCSHPIIFMRDVEAQHIVALMEFMYAGEVNVAQANLSAFLKTAESLKIRGLTDTSSEMDIPKDEGALFLNPQSKQYSSVSSNKHKLIKSQTSCSSTVTSSQDVDCNNPTTAESPPPKRQCKPEPDVQRLRQNKEEMNVNPFAIKTEISQQIELSKELQPKEEVPDYLSDDDLREEGSAPFYASGEVTELPGGMEIIPQTSHFDMKDTMQESAAQALISSRQRYENWIPFGQPNIYENDSDVTTSVRDGTDAKRTRLVHLGQGIEIYEDQLRSVKWSDYRKLTRGLATILFSPSELATCSVTGQRWSRAGSCERPVKPALDRAKVQAIISYVATRFPMVEISRIKQVLAYKCKENSTALKMKAGRYYRDEKDTK